jgi:thiamine pyrophosphate-dependent acetolactate synthase large subunit-like protein
MTHRSTHLLEAYGVDTVFGIPSVHTLDLCRGFATTGARCPQVRHEQDAAYMADGFARVSGKPGVAMVMYWRCPKSGSPDGHRDQ